MAASSLQWACVVMATVTSCSHRDELLRTLWHSGLMTHDYSQHLFQLLTLDGTIVIHRATFKVTISVSFQQQQHAHTGHVTGGGGAIMRF